MAMTLDEFCSRLEHLRLDRSGGLVKPYKPLLVAVVVILIHKGKQQDRNVFLDGGLRSAFQQLLELLFPTWPHAAKPEYPFRHLENDRIWTLVPVEGASNSLRVAKEARAEAWDVLRHVRCAQLDEAVFQRLATASRTGSAYCGCSRGLTSLLRHRGGSGTSLATTCLLYRSRKPRRASRSRSGRSRNTWSSTGRRRRSRKAESSSHDVRSTGGRAARCSRQ